MGRRRRSSCRRRRGLRGRIGSQANHGIVYQAGSRLLEEGREVVVDGDFALDAGSVRRELGLGRLVGQLVD